MGRKVFTLSLNDCEVNYDSDVKSRPRFFTHFLTLL